MLWTLLGSALVGLVGLTVDFTRAQAIHTQLQNAADGAALAAARAARTMTMADRTAAARAYFDTEAGAMAQGATFTLTDMGDNKYRVSASINMPGSLTQLISNQNWHIGVNSDAERGGMNLEVALVLDTTGSMGQQNRIQDLSAAAGDLVDIIVQDVQTPYYSKMALVTYANGVNAGSYAAAVRGAVTGARPITGASWFTSGSVQRTITAATRANPVVITTSANHGYTEGAWIWINGVSGMTQLNNKAYSVHVVSPTTFSLQTLNSSNNLVNVNGSSYNSFSSSGTPRTQQCQTVNCRVVMTANAHGFSTNDWVVISGVGGMGAASGSPDPINTGADDAWQVANLDANTFALIGSSGPLYNAYTANTGSAFCTVAGCQYYRFTSATNSTRIFQISSCVTERVNADANRTANTTDVAPSSMLVGRQYPATGNPCDTGTGIIPLTTDRTVLRNRISGLVASGSTSGHVGAAWGWYMVSPNFGYLWPAAANRPAAYGTRETQKIVVLMTDGAFNSPYCNGVIANNAISGSGNSSDHINCDANASSANQTMAMCTAMKQAGIIVYTIGFRIDNDATATQVMSTCATDSAHYKSASDGTALRDAFRQIGQSISQLRLTH